MAKGTFTPTDYLMDIKGKPYLKTPHRVLWFKSEHGDDGTITTDIVQLEPYPVFKAFIYIAGVLVATGHGTAQPKAGSVYAGRECEKAETAAIGRALGNAGYGTQFSEEEDDDIVDSPVETKRGAAKAPATNGNGAKAFPNVEAKEKFVTHWNATDSLTEEQLKMILGVKYFNEYTGTLADANAAVEKRNRAAFGAKQ